MRASLRSRTIVFLVATSQLVVPGAAAWADAQLEARGTLAPVHIESHSTSSCARVHPPDCGLCRFLASPLTLQAPRLTRLAVVLAWVPGRLERIAPPSLRRRARSQPRAPPALS
jgi:hypothetical protein